MTTYQYHADELVVSLPAGFVDKTTTILEWPEAQGGTAMMLRRAPLEPGTLPDVAKRYSAQLAATLSGYREEPAITVECPLPHEIICLRFREQGRVHYQVHVLLDLGSRMLFMVWGADAQRRDRLDEMVKVAVPTVLLREVT